MNGSELNFGPHDELHSRISLSFSATNLLDRDAFSKSDPMCVVFLSTGPLNDNKFREVGRTEVIQNSLNPEWKETVEVDYFFEETQRIKFEIYDIDSRSSKLTDHDFLGRVETTLAQIVAAQFCRRTYDIDSRSSKLTDHDFLGRVETTLAQIVAAQFCRRTFTLSGVKHKKAQGELTVYATESDDGANEKVRLVCSGVKLEKKDLIGKCDAFLQFYKVNEDKT
ncbi:unnamed protein product [Gongylonema pulchrum]|uniref:C2 domain-containing protein n=1 Tax=Gongylonema pulchrum TaxID=637853 RepID=A0A183E8H0_9BILA|nr:unnamed protein product [Gongylonema pulchrum]